MTNITAPSAKRQSSLAFLEQGIEKAIAVFVGQYPPPFGGAGTKRNDARIRLPRQKIIHDILVFLAEKRAGCVQQFTTTLKDLPHTGQYSALSFGKAGDVGRTSVPTDVRMPTDDSRGAARRIQKNSIEGASVPPGRWVASIAPSDLCVQPKAREVFVNSPQALCVAVERHKVNFSQLEQVSSFSSRRGASIQYAIAIPDIKQPGGTLRAFVLHANQPVKKSRQFVYWAGINANCGNTNDCCIYATLFQFGKVLRDCHAAQVYPKRHRRAPVLNQKYPLPILGKLKPQSINPPGLKSKPAFSRVPMLGSQFGFPPEIVPKHGVDETAGGRLANAFRSPNRVVHHGVGLCARVLKLGQTDKQQVLEARMPDWRNKKCTQLCFQKAESAQPLVANVAHGGSLLGAEARM
jgi:hypothetical protein